MSWEPGATPEAAAGARARDTEGWSGWSETPGQGVKLQAKKGGVGGVKLQAKE